MHQPSGQLALFTIEPSQNDSLTIPKHWQKTYKAWRGEFEVIRPCFVGKSKHKHFDFSVEIFSPDGNCETVLEITAPLPGVIESKFRHVVDKLADIITFLPDSKVSESNLCNDSLTRTEVLHNTHDSLTFKDNSVTESLVSDVTSENDSLTRTEVLHNTHDSLTFKDNSVTESLVSDVTSENDSLTFKDISVTESLVLNNTNDSLTAINIYKAKGTARGDRKYFRYSYKEAGKVKHLHIGGGNIHSVVARSRMQLVRDALARGQSSNQIKQLIRQLRN